MPSLDSFSAKGVKFNMIEMFYDPKVLIPTVTSVVAGIWILKDFLLRRELYPKPEIESDLQIISGPDPKGSFLGLVSINVKNSGMVRLYFDRAYFSIRQLEDGVEYTPIGLDEILTVVDFAQKIVDKSSLFPAKWGYSYVDAGGVNRYKFTVVIPPQAGILSLKTKVFLREKRSDFISDATFFRWDGKEKFKKVKSGS